MTTDNHFKKYIKNVVKLLYKDALFLPFTAGSMAGRFCVV